MSMTPTLFSLNGLATELGKDRRTMGKVLAGVKPDGTIKGHSAWRLQTVLAALGKHAGSVSTFRGRYRTPAFQTLLDRVEGWQEIYLKKDKGAPIEWDPAFAGMVMRVPPATILTWLRSGMPYARAGNWRTGEDFVIKPSWMIDWAHLVGAYIVNEDDAEAARILGMKVLD